MNAKIAGVEEIKIERERKYLIPDQDIAKLIIHHLPKELLIALPRKDKRYFDKNMVAFIQNSLNEKDSLDKKRITLTPAIFNNTFHIKKRRPYYYYDSSDRVLNENKISFSLRQREADWMATIKIMGKKASETLEKTGIIERIEFSFEISNNLVEMAGNNGIIDIKKIIDKKADLKETFDKRIQPHLTDKELIVTESFLINSVRAVYPMSKNGSIQISVDEISSKDLETRLYEFEIEIKFGHDNHWLDSIAIRAFDFFCLIIIATIKKSLELSLESNKLNTKLSKIDIKELFNVIIKKPKINRIMELTQSDSLNTFEEIDYDDEEYNDYKKIKDRILKRLCKTEYKSIMPSTFLPFWINIKKCYDNLEIPGVKSKDEIKTIQTLIHNKLISNFDFVVKDILKTPNHYYNELDTLAKINFVKMAKGCYLFYLAFPESENSHIDQFSIASQVIQNLFLNAAKKAGDKIILQQVEVDCAFILNSLNTKKQEKNLSIENLSLYKIDSNNKAEVEQFLEFKLQEGEIKLQRLLTNRYLIKKQNDLGPVILIDSPTNPPDQLIYLNILDYEANSKELKSIDLK